jgi:hypothetical protein
MSPWMSSSATVTVAASRRPVDAGESAAPASRARPLGSVVRWCYRRGRVAAAAEVAAAVAARFAVRPDQVRVLHAGLSGPGGARSAVRLELGGRRFVGDAARLDTERSDCPASSIPTLIGVLCVHLAPQHHPQAKRSAAA